jgi:hypothetical protein
VDYGPKIAAEARQGLQRLEQLKQQERAEAIAEIAHQPGNEELGVLVLEAIPPEDKAEAAKPFAEVMKLDPYSARLILPSRGWRLYRSGSLAELQVYTQELQAANIPLFWLPLAKIKEIRVAQVRFFSDADPQAIVAYTEGDPHHSDEAQTITFDWSEVSQRVEGLIPIFEEVVELDSKRKIKRREEVQDHAQFCDLHLPSRNLILRCYAGGYQFHQGITLDTSENLPTSIDGETSYAHWRQFNTFLHRYLPDVPVWTDFATFGDTAVDHPEILERVESHIYLFRRQESLWDAAFHLYSSLIFWKDLI